MAHLKPSGGGVLLSIPDCLLDPHLTFSRRHLVLTRATSRDAWVQALAYGYWPAEAGMSAQTPSLHRMTKNPGV